MRSSFFLIENSLRQEEGEWRLLGLLHENNLDLCSESEDDLRLIMEHFAELCHKTDDDARRGG